MARFESTSAEAFDSVFVDPLGRDVVRTSMQQRLVRRADLRRVIMQTPTRAVLLLAGVVRPARESTVPLDAAAGSDEANRVRRFSGFYEATNQNGTWFLRRQLPLDSLNFIRAQTVRVAVQPGKGIDVVDTLRIDIGSANGFAFRFNTGATITSVQLDGRAVKYESGGGVIWFPAQPKRGARLVMRYSLVEPKFAGALPAKDSTKAPAAD
jgi:hypothetical protein